MLHYKNCNVSFDFYLTGVPCTFTLVYIKPCKLPVAIITGKNPITLCGVRRANVWKEGGGGAFKLLRQQ